MSRARGFSLMRDDFCSHPLGLSIVTRSPLAVGGVLANIIFNSMCLNLGGFFLSRPGFFFFFFSSQFGRFKSEKDT